MINKNANPGARGTGNEIIPCDINNVVLRGMSLRNTDYIIGLVIYTGHDTKIMKNSIKAKYKVSKLEGLLNNSIKSIVAI